MTGGASRGFSPGAPKQENLKPRPPAWRLVRATVAGAAWALLLLAPWAAVAQEAPTGDVWFYEGGEPGVTVTIDGRDIAGAHSVGQAIPVDPATPAAVSISLAPPPGQTWQVRGIRVGMLVGGPDSQPPDMLTRRFDTESFLPPGYTVIVNRTLDLSSMRSLGAGAFLMQVSVTDAGGSELYAQSFFVRVEGVPLLTAQGAAVTAVSVATGYGLWQVLKDLKELRDAYDRHRRRRQEARRRLNLDVVGVAEHVAEETLARAGRPAAEIVSIRRAADEAERALGPVRWTATGLGLGAVTMAWLQFLGYLAFDAVGTLMVALEVAAAFLTLALVGRVLLRRYRESARTRTIVPVDAQAERAAEAAAEGKPPA